MRQTREVRRSWVLLREGMGPLIAPAIDGSDRPIDYALCVRRVYRGGRPARGAGANLPDLDETTSGAVDAFPNNTGGYTFRE
jgi:hypothetical protein